MKKPWLTAIVLLLLNVPLLTAAQTDSTLTETTLVLHTATGDIHGTLTIPAHTKGKIPVTLLIAGSGPTDRDGNNPMMKNESLKLLAHGLVHNNIATLRFDKRGIGESTIAFQAESGLSFDDYVNDARGWLELLKKDIRFSKIVVTGHSEGALVGIIAANNNAQGYVSIAGAGRSADKVLKQQLADKPSMIKDSAYPIIDSLVAGKPVEHVPRNLYALFRPTVQQFLISWFRYNPPTELQKLSSIPTLIVQGTNDLQVTMEDANLLAKAHPQAQLVNIKNMNHIFRIVEGDKKANLETYITPAPVSEELVRVVAGFINRQR